MALQGHDDETAARMKEYMDSMPQDPTEINAFVQQMYSEHLQAMRTPQPGQDMSPDTLTRLQNESMQAMMRGDMQKAAELSRQTIPMLSQPSTTMVNPIAGQVGGFGLSYWNKKGIDCCVKENYLDKKLTLDKILVEYDAIRQDIATGSFASAQQRLVALPIWTNVSPQKISISNSFAAAMVPMIPQASPLAVSFSTEYCITMLQYWLLSNSKILPRVPVDQSSSGMPLRYLVTALMHLPMSRPSVSPTKLSTRTKKPFRFTSHLQLKDLRGADSLEVSLLSSELLWSNDRMPLWNHSPPVPFSSKQTCLKLFVSHKWRTSQHPDPNGEDWKRLRKFLYIVISGSMRLYEILRLLGVSQESIVNHLSNEARAETAMSLGSWFPIDDKDNASFTSLLPKVVFSVIRFVVEEAASNEQITADLFFRVAARIHLWIDYCSLPQKVDQKERSPHENALFKLSLQNLQAIQNSAHTLVMNHEQSHFKRAWCVAEYAFPRQTMDMLELGSPLDKESFWKLCFREMVGVQGATPQDVLGRLGLEITNGKDDSEVVCSLLWSFVTRRLKEKVLEAAQRADEDRQEREEEQRQDASNDPQGDDVMARLAQSIGRDNPRLEMQKLMDGFYNDMSRLPACEAVFGDPNSEGNSMQDQAAVENIWVLGTGSVTLLLQYIKTLICPEIVNKALEDYGSMEAQGTHSWLGWRHQFQQEAQQSSNHKAPVRLVLQLSSRFGLMSSVQKVLSGVVNALIAVRDRLEYSSDQRFQCEVRAFDPGSNDAIVTHGAAKRGSRAAPIYILLCSSSMDTQVHKVDLYDLCVTVTPDPRSRGHVPAPSSHPNVPQTPQQKVEPPALVVQPEDSGCGCLIS